MASLIYITYYEENQSTLFQFAMIGDSWAYGSKSFIPVGLNPNKSGVYNRSLPVCLSLLCNNQMAYTNRMRLRGKPKLAPSHLPKTQKILDFYIIQNISPIRKKLSNMQMRLRLDDDFFLINYQQIHSINISRCFLLPHVQQNESFFLTNQFLSYFGLQ